MVTEITDENFVEMVNGSRAPFMLLFTSPWCTVCKKVSSYLDALSESLDHVRFGEVDISTSPKISSELQVLSLPTVLILKDGKELARFTGMIKEKDLIKEIEGLI